MRVGGWNVLGSSLRHSHPPSNILDRISGVLFTNDKHHNRLQELQYLVKHMTLKIGLKLQDVSRYDQIPPDIASTVSMTRSWGKAAFAIAFSLTSERLTAAGGGFGSVSRLMCHGMLSWDLDFIIGGTKGMNFSVLPKTLFLLTYRVPADSRVRCKKQIRIAGKTDLMREYLLNTSTASSTTAIPLASVRKRKPLTFVTFLPEPVPRVGSIGEDFFPFWKRAPVNSPDANVGTHRSLGKQTVVGTSYATVSNSVLQAAVCHWASVISGLTLKRNPDQAVSK